MYNVLIHALAVVGSPRSFVGPTLALLVGAWNYGQLRSLFSNRIATMQASWNDIGIPTRPQELWENNWYKLRRTYAVWKAGEMYAKMDQRYQAFRLLVPSLIILSYMFLPAIATAPGPDQQSTFGPRQFAVVGLYMTVVVTAVAIRHLKAGVEKALELIRRGQRGDL